MKRSICTLKILFVFSLFLQSFLIHSNEGKDNIKREYFYFNLQTAYYPPHALGTTGSFFSPSFFSPQIKPVAPNNQISPSSWGSVKLISYLGYYKFIKVLDNPDSLLFQGNGIDLDLNIGLSPVLALLKGSISLTPIAFVNLYTAVEVGLGWKGFGFKGIGVHIGNGDYSKSTEFYSEITMGGRLQFDLNAVLGGEWTHIITVLGSSILHINNAHAISGQLWIYKSDEGKTINGFTINPYALLAYKMPLSLNTIGFLYEGKTYIGDARSVSTISNKGWGSDFFYHNISFVTKFEITSHLSLDMQLKLSTKPMYTEDTIGMSDILKRTITNNSYMHYDSIGFSLTYKI
ncbi:hypothetical protein [Borrelia sp. RT5S]|uniref:hypothetical protein n=1 Tax=Borrelia sp. RT5S TaxID=2898581 RepID=UPI001E440E1F|nr:hypothetical protein [Borrelia sp. RT5S]UGQ16535.1 hypothetical protein LSO06_02115 [Borrelia sp. RT5S]